MNPLIQCPSCGGRGKIELSLPLADTLAAVVRFRRATAPQLRQVGFAFITVTALNNRLEELRRLGFLKRHREGRTWVYSPTKRKEPNGKIKTTGRA